MYRNVLVPLDGSPFSEHALPLAVDVARQGGGTVQLTHVRLPVSSIYSEAPLFIADEIENNLTERERARWQEYLEDVAVRIRKAAPGVTVTTSLQEGEAAETLQKQAEVTGADLVVMTTHARGALGRLWLGSVADELLRHLPIPLLLARPAAGAPDLSGQALPKLIIVPLDGNPLAEQMVRPAAELAKLSHAGLTLLRVIKPLAVLTPPQSAGASLGQMASELVERLRSTQEELRKEAHTYLERVAIPLRAEGLHVLTRVSMEEQPAIGVLHEAEAQHAGIIALATHGRRGLTRLVLGSVADKVIRGSQSAVLVCRPRL